MGKKFNLSKLLLTAFTLVFICLTFAAYWFDADRQTIKTLLQAELEDYILNYRRSKENCQYLSEKNTEYLQMSLRSLAMLLAKSPAQAGSAPKLQQLCESLGSTEIDVTDGRGVIEYSSNPANIGIDMAQDPRYMVLVPFLKRRNVEYLHPLVATSTVDAVQYSAISREDSAGLVCVGFEGEGIQQIYEVVGMRELLAVASSRQDRWFEAKQLSGRKPLFGYSRIIRDGKPNICFSTTYADQQLTIGTAEKGLGLADCTRWLTCVSIVLCILLCLALKPKILTALGDVLRAFFVLFMEKGNTFTLRSFLADTVKNIRMGFLVAVMAIMLAAVPTAWCITGHLASHSAAELLRKGLSDLLNDINRYAGDEALSYVGNVLCRTHASSEAIRQEQLPELCRKYAIDSITVVNSNGIVTAATNRPVGAKIADDLELADFNCLLQNQQVYSKQFGSIQEATFTKGKQKVVGVAFPNYSGYVIIGLSGTSLKRDMDLVLEHTYKDWGIGVDGYFLCIDNATAKVIFSGSPLALPNQRFADICDNPGLIDSKPSMSIFRLKLYGADCACMIRWLPAYTYMAILPQSSVDGRRNIPFAICMSILCILAVIGTIGESRLSMLVSRLRESIGKEQARQEEDMAVAATVQKSTLPLPMPPLPDIRVSAVMDPAREVGGDFYDYCILPDGRLFFLIADVSGKGIPAALFMMKAKSLVKSCILKYDDIGEAITNANIELCRNNTAQLFVTAWCGLLDTRTGEVAFVNAGHNPPLVKHPGALGGGAEWVQSNAQLVLGMMEDICYVRQTLMLAPGDTMVLYTDGVTEAADSAEELYGEDRLEAVLQNTESDWISAIRKDIAAFVGGAEQSDDITIVTIDFMQRKED